MLTYTVSTSSGKRDICETWSINQLMLRFRSFFFEPSFNYEFIRFIKPLWLVH